MSLKRQTLWSILPLLSITIVNLVSVPLFYRFLGPEMYALWFYVLTFAGSFGFVDMGFGVAVGRYIGLALGRGDSDSVRQYWGTGNAVALPLLGVMSLLFVTLGVAFGPQWFRVPLEHVTLLRWSFVAGGAGLFLNFYAQFWLILSQTHFDFKFLAILRTAISLLGLLPSVALAWWTGNPLLLIAWGTAVAALQLGVFLWHARRQYHLGLELGHAGWGRVREMAAYSLKTFAALLTNSFLGSADRLVAGRLASPAGFTHYNICANVGGRIQGLSTAMMGPVFSNTNRSLGGGSSSSVAAIYDQTFAFTFPWYLLAVVGAALWHPVLLRAWLGAELGAQVGPLFTPVVAACCLTAISNISAAQLGSLNRVGTGIIFNLLAAGLLMLGAVLGWRWGGLPGIAWGFLFSRSAMVAQDVYVLRLIGAGGWRAAGTWRQIASQCAVGLALSFTLLLGRRDSLWQLLPASAHAAFMTTWILREPLRHYWLRRETALAMPSARR